MSSPAMDQRPGWETSSYGHGTDTTPMQLTALGEHLTHCSRPDRTLDVLLAGGDALRCFVLGRLVTSVTLLGAVVGLGWLIWS